MLDDNGKVMPFQANVEIILEQHQDLKDCISMCEFSYQIRKQRPMPWGGESGDPWTDRDDAELKSWIEIQLWWSPKENLIQGALLAVAHRNPSHPVRQYLENLKWDGMQRLDTWTTKYLGVKDSPYSRTVARKSLIQAVARIFKPGCKADSVPILEGPQGIRKSMALRALLPKAEWFEDGMLDLHNKDGLMSLQGKWFRELPELDAFGKAEISRIKAFITDQEDCYRVPYGRHIQTFPRQSVFWGSINEYTYLPDSSGNRRFWPLECTSIATDALAKDRDHLWAEAVQAFKRGELWYLTEDETALAKEFQESRRIEDPWEAPIEKFLKRKENVTLAEVMKNGLSLMHQNCRSAEAYRISKILSDVFGWRKTKITRGKDRVNGFTPNLD
jgi:putative DNA primase/helicase